MTSHESRRGFLLKFAAGLGASVAANACRGNGTSGAAPETIFEFHQFARAQDKDDTAAFQRAFEQIAAIGGGRLHLPARSAPYSISEELLLPPRLSLLGEGGPLLRQLIEGRIIFRGEDIDQLELQGIVFEGQGTSSRYRDPDDGLITAIGKSPISDGSIRSAIVSACEFRNGYSGLCLTGFHGIRVYGNRIDGFRRYGLLVANSTDFIIEDNKIEHGTERGAANAYGIVATGNLSRGQGAADGTIRRNLIRGVPSWDGIMSHQISKLLIQENEILDVRTGIDISTDDEPIENVTIAGNRIVHTVLDSYRGKPALHASILVSSQGAAPPVRGITIKNNTCDLANNAPGLVPAGNAVAAICLDNMQDAVVSGNIIKNLGTAYKGFAGIGIYRPGPSVVVTANTISGTTFYYAIVAQAKSGEIVPGLVISENRFSTTGRPPNFAYFNSARFIDLVFDNNKGHFVHRGFDTSGAGVQVEVRPGPAKALSRR